MKQTIKQTLILGSILIIAVLLIQYRARSFEAKTSNLTQDAVAAPSNQGSQLVDSNKIAITDVEKIEVYHFHATQQCVSCTTIGKYVEELIADKFSQEVKNGKIVFKSLNIDLPENAQIAREYRVSGSALYVNAIKDGQSYKQEDLTVWRLVNNEVQLKTYFENKMQSLLGK